MPAWLFAVMCTRETQDAGHAYVPFDIVITTMLELLCLPFLYWLQRLAVLLLLYILVSCAGALPRA
jgi:hypothetical protein